MTAAEFAWTDQTVRSALKIQTEQPASDVEFGRVTTDTRSVEPGDLFVALRGERFDGHDFVAEASTRGARGAVVSRPMDVDHPLLLYLVADTREALGRLARYRRRALPGEVIGVTGSSGKTTVKELLAAALSGDFRVHATHGNLNNQVGLPLSMMEAPVDSEFLVLEMGTNEPGEIRTLTHIAEPDHAVLTTVSEAHLSGLGSLEGVLEEKLDLLRGTRQDGTVLVGDRPRVLPAAAREVRRDVRVGGFSEEADADFRGGSPTQDSDGKYRFRMWDREIQAGIPGLHGAQNLILALACARLLGVDEETAIQRASEVGPGSLRGEVRMIGGLTMILDCYNANPQSMEAALELLAGLPGSSNRVAFLGSMLELGERSPALHRAILEKALALPLDLVVAIGEFAAPEVMATAGLERAPSPALVVVPTIEEGYAALRSRLTGSDTVLLKGSRGVALESLLPRFEADYGSEPRRPHGSRGRMEPVGDGEG